MGLLEKNVWDGLIYCLTCDDLSCGRDAVSVVGAMLRGGAKVIQYREKNKSKQEMLEECCAIRKLTQEAGALFIVNDHIDLALTSKADGVHVGQADMSVERVRALVGSDIIIGLSVTTIDQIQAALKQSVNFWHIDYIGIGPIYQTSTKLDITDYTELEDLQWACQHSTVPVVAIGGIKEEHFPELTAIGVTCVAIISSVVSAENIGKKITDLQESLQRYLK